MPLPALLAAGLGLQGLTSIAQGVLGMSQLDEAEELRNKQRPEYSIEDEYYDNRNLAANSAQSGLTQESKDFYSGQANRGLTYSIDAALAGGGGINSFSNIYDSYLQGNNRIAAEDSQLRLQNIRNLMEQNSVLAGQKTQQWAINEYEPYKDAQQAAAANEQSGTKNLFGAATGIIGGLSTAQNALTYDKMLNNTGGMGSVANNQILQAPSTPAPRLDGSTIDPATTSGVNPIDEEISKYLKRLRTTQLTGAPSTSLAA